MTSEQHEKFDIEYDDLRDQLNDLYDEIGVLQQKIDYFLENKKVDEWYLKIKGIEIEIKTVRDSMDSMAISEEMYEGVI